MAHDLGPLPKIHERHIPVRQAENELLGFLIEWQKKHSLTEAEYLMLLSGEIQRRISSLVSIERRK